LIFTAPPVSVPSPANKLIEPPTIPLPDNKFKELAVILLLPPTIFTSPESAETESPIFNKIFPLDEFNPETLEVNSESDPLELATLDPLDIMTEPLSSS
jgi:hypothetical protein